MQAVRMNDLRAVRDEVRLGGHPDLLKLLAHVTLGIGMVVDRDSRVDSGTGIGFGSGPGKAIGGSPGTLISSRGPGLGLGIFFRRSGPVELSVRWLAVHWRLGS